MKRRLSPLGVRILGRIAATAVRALGATWRVEGPRVPPAPMVGGLWHAGLLAAAYLFRDHGVSIVVSRSRDGDLIDAVLRPLGFGESLRGSSSRGGAAALKAGVRRLRGGARVAVLLDGPKGPPRKAKSGVIQLARSGHAPLIPCAIVSKPTHRFGSWDGTQLPLPFARVRFALGEPVALPNESSDAADASALSELEARIAALERDLCRELGIEE